MLIDFVEKSIQKGYLPDGNSLYMAVAPKVHDLLLQIFYKYKYIFIFSLSIERINH